MRSYTSDELEQATGFDRRTIAYYVQEGLLPKVGRRGPRTLEGIEKYLASGLINGIGFKSADAIARRLGIPVDSLMRAQAGVQHILQDLSSQGHCAAERERLVETTARFLETAP